MKLSKFYTDQPKYFAPVNFISGLNVVLAEIRLPENREKDTHNLGKTTLGRLLDFGLLAKRDKNFFLFKHKDIFSNFVFFLELELVDGSYVTIRRSVADASKIAFKKNLVGHQDYSKLPIDEWDHFDVPFSRAIDMLDSFLNWRVTKPWSYRKGLGYLLRTQDDYRDVFQLRRYAGAHSDWKPFLAELLGFDSKLITKHYEIEQELEEKEKTSATLRAELGGLVKDSSKIDGILLLKRKDVETKQSLIDAFDFQAQDKAETKQIVEEINENIASLNARRYTLLQNRNKITSSIDTEELLFNPDDASKLFNEVGVLFKGQIKREFVQLIAFSKAITEERQFYLNEELSGIEGQLIDIEAELKKLGALRSEKLAYLGETDAFRKYKRLSAEMVTVRTDIEILERQRGFLDRLQNLRSEIRSLTELKNKIHTEIEANVHNQNSNKASLFSTIRLFFSEIVEEVIDRKALLSVSPNKLGHLEFKAEILDEASNATSADDGHTYRKLLCIAFDMALLRAHSNVPFPRFVFHDGVFESLDDRKKENLLEAIRRYAGLGIQSIITLIDSDLPYRDSADMPVFRKTETVLSLHDEDESGRLFKMPTW